MAHDVPDAVAATLLDYTLPLLLDFSPRLARRLAMESQRDVHSRLEEALEALGRRRKEWACVIQRTREDAARVFALCREAWDEEEATRLAVFEANTLSLYGVQAHPSKRKGRIRVGHEGKRKIEALITAYDAFKEAFQSRGVRTQDDLNRLVRVHFQKGCAHGQPRLSEFQVTEHFGPAMVAYDLLEHCTGLDTESLQVRLSQARSRQARMLKNLLGLGPDDPLPV